MTLEAARQQLAVLRATTTSVELGPMGYAAVVTAPIWAAREVA
jgi:hypothetical protein